MLRQLSHFIRSIFIILVLSSTNLCVHGCNTDQILCSISYPYDSTWCCSDSLSCGSSYESCTQKNISDSYMILIIVMMIFVILSIYICLVIVVICYFRRSKTQSRYSVGRVAQQTQYTYQQQPIQRASVITHVNPGTYITATTPSIHSIYEELPPSYDTIVKDDRYIYPVSTGNVANEETNLRV